VSRMKILDIDKSRDYLVALMKKVFLEAHSGAQARQQIVRTQFMRDKDFFVPTPLWRRKSKELAIVSNGRALVLQTFDFEQPEPCTSNDKDVIAEWRQARQASRDQQIREKKLVQIGDVWCQMGIIDIDPPRDQVQEFVAEAQAQAM